MSRTCIATQPSFPISVAEGMKAGVAVLVSGRPAGVTVRPIPPFKSMPSCGTTRSSLRRV